MRRLSAVFASAILVAAPIGCSDNDPQPGDTTTPDTTPDVEPDTTPDIEPDTTPDVEPDVEPDTNDTTDTNDDDTEVTNDTEVSDDADTTPPDTLVIAKGDRCSTLVPFESPALPFEDAGTTIGMTDDYIYTTGTACGGVGSALWGDASPDVVYTITPNVSGIYNIALRPAAGYDPALMVTDKCPPIGEDGFLGLTCHAVSDQGTEGSPELMRLRMVAGQTYYLLVDGWNNNVPVSGNYTLSVALGEDCSDDIDNDLNGLTDCRDPQCTSDPLCNESNFENGCKNRVDDDSDGLTDCDDPDCAGTDACNEATYPNGCRNTTDDDGDGLTDCADPDCAGLNACNEATYSNGCSNNQDDDGDGLTDCADPNCFSAPNCNEANYAEGCTNGLDDDGDGRTDCADPDCGASPNCLGTGETCADPLVLIEGAPTNGTTVGRVNDYTTSASTCLVKASATSFGAATPDAVYSFTPTSTGRYDIRVTGNFDLGLTLTTNCAFTGGATCYGTERGLLSDGERIVAQLTANTTYFIIVDGWSNTNVGNVGTFVITAKRAVSSEVETHCENRLDDDNDGQTDCADADCAFDLAACTEAGKCTDGIDNDNDGLTDCADPECRIDPVTCPRPIGDNCGNPLTVTTTNPVTFNTCSFDVDFTLSATGCLAGSTGAPDAVTRFTASQAGSYWVELVGTGSYDSILNVVRSATCPTSVGSCAASRDATTTGTEAVAITLAANETIHIITTGDGSASTRCGSAQLKVSLLPPENCSNGVDDDRDGQTDCNDSDCRNSRSCNEYINGDEACQDGLDNDNDGLTDCADPDCRADTELCPSPLGDNCHNPFVVDTFPWFVNVDTCTMTNDFRVVSGGGCASTSTTHTGQDIVAKLVIPQNGNYRIAFDTSIDGTTFDSILNVVRGNVCPASPLSECVIGSDVGNPEFGRIENAIAGDTYWIFADGWSTACSNGRLSVTRLEPEVCNDGVDNDGNNLVDCADTAACSQTPFCNERLNTDGCSDGVDNDNDGFTDCYDRDCIEDPACPGGIPGGSCGNPFNVTTANFAVQVDTCGYTSDFNWTGLTASGCRGSTTNTAGDFVIDFEPPVAGNYRIVFNANTSFDSVINVVKNGECPTSPVAQCTAGVDGGNPERIDIAAAEGDYFYIIVDGYSAACGLGNFSITRLDDEICDDNIDNDGDGRTDCADPDCFGVGTCPAGAPGENCSSPTVIGLGSSSFNTCNFARDFTTTGAGCLATTAPDVVLRFTAATAGSYTFTTNSSWLAYEHVLNFVRGTTCPTTTVGQCAASTKNSSSNATSTVTLSMTEGETIWVIAGANFNQSTTECGAATIVVTRN